MDEVVGIAARVYTTEQPTITLNGVPNRTETVKRVLDGLDDEKFMLALDNFSGYRLPVKNKTAFMRTTLVNACLEFNTHTENRVSVDLYGGV